VANLGTVVAIEMEGNLGDESRGDDGKEVGGGGWESGWGG